ncbi:MAG: rRNA maturation RNase YbeY [bacterium]
MNKITINKIPPNIGLTIGDIKTIVQESLKVFGIDKKIVEILFVDISQIHQLNLTNRQIDKPTDVLSFPQMPINTKNYSILGSIVINIDTVREKGENLTDVIKHGVLHILNYDHETDEKSWDEAAQKINCQL